MHEGWFWRANNMEIKFQIQGGHSFTLELDPSETIRHVKEKVQNAHHIPVDRQILLLHYELLPDFDLVSECHLHDDDRIVLQVTDPPPLSPVSESELPPQPKPTPDLQLPTLPTKEYYPSGLPPWDSTLQLIPPEDDYDPFAMTKSPSSSEVIPMPQPPAKLVKELEETPASSPLSPEPWFELVPPSPHLIPNPPPPPPPTLMVNVKVPRSEDRFPIEMEKTETVLNLKEKLAARPEMRGVRPGRMVLQSPSLRMELSDDQALENIFVSESTDVDVFLKPTMPIPGRRLKVKVIPRHSNQRVEIEVNSTDRVSVLRIELDRLHQLGGFRLPPQGGYFFIHRQMNMDETMTFQWHQVRNGDTIETFDGFIRSPNT